MIKSIILTSLIVISFAGHSQSLSKLDTSRFFDFWVGEWTVSWDEGNGVEELGTNTITRQLDGQVITEQFRILKGQNAGFKGTSISVFQPQLNRWKQAWADNQGGYFDFVGDFDGEKRMFYTADFDGKISRMVFYDINDKSMTWDWESSADSGETWNLAWRIYYKRR